MNYINPNAPAAGLTRLLNMRDNNPATQLAYVPTKDIAAMGSMGGLEFNPYSGIPQARGIAAVADGGSIQDAPLAPVADELASRGRYGDSMLLHVRPDELQGLASLGTLTINPDTGLPEAFSFKSLLPVVGGIAGSILLGPAFGAAFGKGALAAAFGTGVGAGLGSFAGGLAAGQSPGQAALGGLMSGATAGFMQGLAPGLEAATPGLDSAGGSAITDISGQGFVEGATQQAITPSSLTAAGAPQSFINELSKVPATSFSGETLLSAYGPNTPSTLDVSGISTPAAKAAISPSVGTATGLQDTFVAQKAVERGPFSKFLGAEDIAKGQRFTRPEALAEGYIPSDITIPERAAQVLGDKRTYIGAGISAMLQPPPEYEELDIQEPTLGPSYVPRERTLAGGVQSPARSSEEYLRMALEGGYQPLSEQYRYAAQGGLVGLVEGGTPEQGVLQSQLSPVLQQQQTPLLQQQEQQISERARQDELLQRDQAMSRGQQFIEQPTGNQQLFQQMQAAGQVIGQQLAQGPEAYATPPGQSAAPSSFVSGTSFGFNTGGLVGLAEGGTPKEIFEKKSYQTLLDMGVPWNELKGIISGEHFPNTNYLTAINNVGATGLFQFIPDTLKTLGVTQEEVINMSAKEQANLYAKYLKTFGWKKGVPLAVMQASPGRVKRGKFDKLSSDSIIYDKESSAAKQNKQWQNKEGNITPKSISSYYEQHRKEFDRRANVSSEDSEGMPAVQKETQMAKLSDTENDAGILSRLRSILSGEDKQYEVQSGDTLSAIARQQGMSLDELLEANKNISDPNVISRGQEITVPDQSSFLDRVRGALGYAQGGDIGRYFEGQVVGNGDGMSDQILFEVEGNNPDKALLSRDEYVIPADVVAMLGNGSSNAGSEQLDSFIKGIRQDSFGTQEQQRQLNAQQGLRGLV